jgi:MFS transporter, DHA1 family, multidrug resistance protein
MNPATKAPFRISKNEFIALIAAIWALNALAIDIMLPALPYMGEALKIVHENDRQLVITAYFLGFGVAQLLFGPICDRFGRRSPLMFGLVLYVLATVLAIFATSFEMLLALRAIQGIGAAATRISSQSAIRDRFEGRDMAEVMSLAFMVFMIMPIIAPGAGQIILLTGPWQFIFLFMAVVATGIGIWCYLRMEESLSPENRRPLTFDVITKGFYIVFSDRQSLFYAIASTFVLGSLFGFINTAQQIYVEIYGLGALFPVAFAGVAALMSLASFLNSKAVGRFGMRRLSHGALLMFIALAGIWLVLAYSDHLPFIAFFSLLASIMFMFGWCGSNMNSLSMEPLGAVAGTASSVFGFLQTAGGAVIGAVVGRSFNGTVTPVATGFFCLGIIALVCVLIAEKGRLFGVGKQYADAPPPADMH